MFSPGESRTITNDSVQTSNKIIYNTISKNPCKSRATDSDCRILLTTIIDIVLVYEYVLLSRRYIIKSLEKKKKKENKSIKRHSARIRTVNFRLLLAIRVSILPCIPLWVDDIYSGFVPRVHSTIVYAVYRVTYKFTRDKNTA